MSVPPTAPTGLTTLGRCLIAAGLAACACAVVLDERDLLRIGAFVIALPVLASLLAKHVRRTLRARRTVSPAPVCVGARADVALELHRVARLAGRFGPRVPGLDTGRVVLTDAVPHALGHAPRLVVTPPRRADEPVTAPPYSITPVLRGRHQIGPLTVRVGDPLGLAEHEVELTGRTSLTVLPRVTPLRGWPPGLGRGEGHSGSTGLRRGPGERDTLIREYQPGDALRTVHWRSTARRDELMVRLEERPWRGGVTVLIDRRAHAHRGSGASASMEWAVALAASVGHHLIDRGRRVTLVTEDGVVLASGRDSAALLDSLALLGPSTRPGLRPGDPDGGELLALLGAVGTADVAQLVRRGAGGEAHAVLLDVAAWGGGGGYAVAAPAAALAGAGWTVQVGTPARGPAEVWDELCRRPPARLGTGR